MSVLLAAALAGAAAGVLVALPGAGELRFRDLAPAPAARPALARGSLLLLAPLAWAVGPLVAGLALGALLLGARVRRGRHRRAVVAAERDRAVEACGVLAAELSAGRAPDDALAAAAAVAVGPARSALADAAAAARLGGDVARALTAGARASAVGPALRALAACWTVCSTSGSGLAAAVERLEQGLRADAAQRRAVDAELAGPRATVGLLAVLPAGGLLMAAGLGADPLHVLLHTPLGLACLLLGLGLDGLGVLWTGRLVARAGGSG